MLERIKLYGIGIMIGIADVIPGVSGSTIAVSFNVYDRLIAVLTPNVKKILAQWKFWLPLGLGDLTGILFFAKLVSFLFANYATPTFCFFIGIIAGSLPQIYCRTRPAQKKLPAITALICTAFTFTLMFAMIFVLPSEGSTVTALITPQVFFFLLFAGVIGATVMIIPGISGSFILLVLGVYQTIIAAMGALADTVFGVMLKRYAGVSEVFAAIKMPFLTLLPVAIGIIIGLFCGAALIRLLLRIVPRQTYGAILGLLAGAILVIFPKTGFDTAAAVVISAVCFLAGTGAALYCARTSQRGK